MDGLLKYCVSKALIVSVTLFVALLLGEMLTRIWFRQSMDFDMEFWKYATQIKRASKYPLLGHEHRPSQRANLMGVEVTTNSFGLRGPETKLAKPAKTYRIIVLGDSLTMGWGAAQDQIFPSQLERMLNSRIPPGLPQGVRYEVLNLGVGNYNTVQEVESLQVLGLRFDPDLILMGHYINDAEPISDYSENFLIEHSYLYTLGASRFRRLPFGYSKLATYKEYYRGLYSPARLGWQAMQVALAKLAKIGTERNIPVVVYLLPELHDLRTYPFLDINQNLIARGEQLGLPVVDLLPDFIGFSPEEKLWVSLEDAHPNELAHSMIARAIYSSLAGGVLKHFRAEAKQLPVKYSP